MKILVTGGAGFIGSHIVDALIGAGHRTIVLDNLSSGSLKNINPRARFYRCDIRSSGVARIFRAERCSILIHHAAQVSLRYSVTHPLEDADINILGSIRLFEAARVNGVKKIIFSSSGGAMYQSSPKPISESSPPLPASPYGIAKLAVEHYLRYVGSHSTIPWVAFRYSNVYGPRQNGAGEAGVIAVFTQQFLNGKIPTINGTGRQSRDFVHVEDVVRANLLAVGRDVQGILNIATGHRTSIQRISALIRFAIGTPIRPAYGSAKEGEILHSCLNTQRARRALGWTSRIGIEKGIANTVRWFQSHTDVV